MSALDKLRSFAESREVDSALVPCGLSYGDCRSVTVDVTRMVYTIARLRGALQACRSLTTHQETSPETVRAVGVEVARVVTEALDTSEWPTARDADPMCTWCGRPKGSSACQRLHP